MPCSISHILHVPPDSSDPFAFPDTVHLSSLTTIILYPPIVSVSSILYPLFFLALLVQPGFLDPPDVPNLLTLAGAITFCR